MLGLSWGSVSYFFSPPAFPPPEPRPSPTKHKRTNSNGLFGGLVMWLPSKSLSACAVTKGPWKWIRQIKISGLHINVTWDDFSLSFTLVSSFRKMGIGFFFLLKMKRIYLWCIIFFFKTQKTCYRSSKIKSVLCVSFWLKVAVLLTPTAGAMFYVISLEVSSAIGPLFCTGCCVLTTSVMTSGSCPVA